MRFGEMTVSQVKEYCHSHPCHMCQFLTDDGKCFFHEGAAENWDTDLEVVPSSGNEEMSFVQKLEELRKEK